MEDGPPAMVFGKTTVDQQRLEQDLHAAGVRAGDVLVVHSSLRRVGWIEGGPTSFLRALKKVLGPKGTLVMPTFSFSLAAWGLPAFQAWRTSSRVGALTEHFWRQPHVLRTPHPTHSVAVWGHHASILAPRDIDYEPLGVGSPLDRARQLGAKVLLVGVGQNRNSTVHVAESLAGMPYFQVPFSTTAPYDEAWYYPDRHTPARRLVIREMPGSSEGFSVLDAYLAGRGITQQVLMGRAASTIASASDLCQAVVELLHGNPIALLGQDNPSEISVRRLDFMKDRLRTATEAEQTSPM